MPRFYLHLSNGNGFTEDLEGDELADVKAAHNKAIDSLRDVMAEELRRGEINLASFVEIEDEHHRLLMTITFADAVRVSTDRAAAKAGRRHG